jgi:hypothetical protein
MLINLESVFFNFFKDWTTALHGLQDATPLIGGTPHLHLVGDLTPAVKAMPPTNPASTPHGPRSAASGAPLPLRLLRLGCRQHHRRRQWRRPGAMKWRGTLTPTVNEYNTESFLLKGADAGSFK